MIHNKKDHKFCTKDSNQCNKLIKSLLKPKFSVSQNLTVPLKTHQTESYINVRNLKLIPRNKNPVEKAHSQYGIFISVWKTLLGICQTSMYRINLKLTTMLFFFVSVIPDHL